MPLLVLPAALALVGVIYMLAAVVNERRMHQHRQPGVSYATATFRRDGGWRRADLFTAEGLAFQRRAARDGVIGGALWVVALVLYVVMGWMSASP
ncbi:MAG: hypothetical protein ACRENU_11530 [Gemmatimonadaceae bacterium]